ncbi:MAG: hypothetical protein COB93_02380, partial [Sneathiella sp.]
DLGLNYTQIGTLIGLFMLPGMFLAIPAGFAGRFLSDRFIVGIGLLTLGAGGGLASIAENFELLAAARLICGAGFVCSTIFFTKIVADLFAGKELATAMGAFVMSWPCGIAMGQIGHGWLAANFDWQVAFVVASIYCVAGALLVMIFCKEIPGAAKLTGGFRFTLNRNEIFLTLTASLVWAFFNAGYVVYLSFAPRVLVAGGYDTVSALGVISLASWLMIFSGVTCGLIADRSGKADLVLYILYGSSDCRFDDFVHFAFGNSLKFVVWSHGDCASGRDHGLIGASHETGKPGHRHGTFFYNLLRCSSPCTRNRRVAL